LPSGHRFVSRQRDATHEEAPQKLDVFQHLHEILGKAIDLGVIGRFFEAEIVRSRPAFNQSADASHASGQLHFSQHALVGLPQC
jgi:hypothetical protein